MLRRKLGAIFWTSAFVIALGLAAAPARADDMFLQLGDIQGEATARGYEKWIDIVSWSWGVSNPTTIGSGTGGLSAGRVTVSDLNLMKFADSATPRLLDGAAQGTHFPKATFSVRRSSDGFEYLRIRLEDVLVSSDQLSAGGDRPAESVSLSFARVVLDYTPNPGKNRVSFGWDVASNVAFSPAP
jgi:type VI secretion system secreted protein Hcp